MLSDMVECVGERWGMQATSLVLGKNVVCAMAGCGSSWEKNCHGGCVLWGHWLCKTHLYSFGRQKDGDGPDLKNVRPEQPRQRIGKSNKGGARAQTPAAMGYTMADMVLMSIIADRMRATNIENKRLRKKLVKLESQVEEAKQTVSALETELAKQRRETERESWKTRFEECLERERKAKEKFEIEKERWIEKKKELELKLESSRKKCNGFVAGVAKNISQFGVEVYHVQEETRGLFITKNKLLEDIGVREKLCERQQEDLTEVKRLTKDLTEKLTIAKREGSQFFLEVQALEMALKRVYKKSQVEESARILAEMRGKHLEKKVISTSEYVDELRLELSETEVDKEAKEVQVESLEKEVEKFRVRTERTAMQRHKQFEKDYSKVRCAQYY
jgi:hypothetical protein